MGGTNAFIILEQPPAVKESRTFPKPRLFTFSAKSEKALNDSVSEFADFLENNPDINLDNCAFTLQAGRKPLAHRMFFTSNDRESTLNIIRQSDSKKLISGTIQREFKRPVVFLLPGIGDHYVGMGYDLYCQVKVFKAAVDQCAVILKDFIDVDIRKIIYPDSYERKESDSRPGLNLKKMLESRVDKSADPDTLRLNQTLYAQPALFTIEYALSKLWIHLGIVPDAIIGHSMGEYVAACLSGVLSLEDALKLIATRAKLVNELPKSSMLAVSLSEKEIRPFLKNSISISLVNLPNLCVIAGSEEEIKGLEKVFKEKKILFRYVQNSHAFHTKMLDPVIDDFVKEIKGIRLNTPQIPYTSNLTGNWITNEEARDPYYWGKHASHTARFSDALEKAWLLENSILLEAGPGNTLSVLAMQHPQRMKSENPLTIASLRAAYDNQSDLNFLFTALGKLWLNGVDISWEKLYAEDSKPQRIPLPTYPFQRENFWVDGLYSYKDTNTNQKTVNQKRKNFSDWFYVPEWVKSEQNFEIKDALKDEDKLWVIFRNDNGFADLLKKQLEENKQNTITVNLGESYSKENDYKFSINPRNHEDYDNLFSQISGKKFNSLNIIHLGCISETNNQFADYQDETTLYLGFYSLLFITQALSKNHITLPTTIGVITTQVHKVSGYENIHPGRALVIGPCGVIPKEISNIKCFNVDLFFKGNDSSLNEVTKNIISEFNFEHRSQLIAYRDMIRWTKEYKPVNLDLAEDAFKSKGSKKNQLRKKGIYLITGGTGGIGLTISKYLAANFQARIILTQKSEIPPKSTWRKWLADNPGDKSLLRQKLERLVELEDLGAEVSVFKADVYDKLAMQNVLNESLKMYGTINGVIHAAGIVRAGITLAKTKEVADSVLIPKVQGTLLLGELIENLPLDFLILFSSVTSVITPFAEIDYSAANAFLDSYSEFSNSKNKFHTLSINWPGWKDIGQLKNLVPLKGTEKWKETALESAISSDEGLKAFLLALNSGLGQVIVNPEPLLGTDDALHSSEFFDFETSVPVQKTKEKSREDNVVLKVTDSPIETIENKLVELWKNILGYNDVRKDDNFFDLGGHSLLMGRLQVKINEVFDEDISLVDLYEYPTIKTLANFISKQKEIIVGKEIKKMNGHASYGTDVAIIGMAGRYPKAKNIKEFWNNLVDGVEAISFFSNEELEYLPKGNLNSELKFVRARGVLENADKFDAEFFGYNPREAALMDPQHRVFLECAWEALEDAGYCSENYEGAIGVFAGSSLSTYLMFNVLTDREKQEEVVNSYQLSDYSTITGNDNSFLTTKVAYKLGLKGPAVNIQTACSTSLIAIGQAYQNLISGQCSMALAGGVSITFPQKRGYFFVDGSIGSIDGHCRTFDAQATGTVFSSGAGVVVLKRLEDALRDGDSIYAVIKSVAMNNDGANKAGYMTPSVEGQAEVIKRAQQFAGVEADTINYIETHGTGTPVGDPIEIAGLEKAFRLTTDRKQFCGIGSVKSNVGHTDTAAGVTSIMKTALALKNRMIPPTLHYKNPNPRIDFKNSPFYVVDKPTKLNGQSPARAGVSSFGVGGTNAHAILEEFVNQSPDSSSSDGSDKQIIILSAKTETSLKNNIIALKDYFRNNPDESLPNAAYTLQVGRKEFQWRQFVVAEYCLQASEQLEAVISSGMNKAKSDENHNPHLVFMFPGQGAQYVNMGKELYIKENLFRDIVDEFAEYLIPHLGLDIRELLFPDINNDETAKKLEQTVYTQPALFIIEYAIARLLLSYGIRPASMIGHSVGDYIAACLAGVFKPEDALYIIAQRAGFMQKQKPGSMLSVRLNEIEVSRFLNDDISLAAVNSPKLTVLSGPTEKIKELSAKLSELSIENRMLFTSHAYHSRMMDPALKPFTEVFSKIELKKPSAPFISSQTGTWITDEQAVDPEFWASQLRNPVRFSDGIIELQKKKNLVFIELGPGRALSTMVSQHTTGNVNQTVITTLTQPNEDSTDQKNFYSAVGKLWIAGLKIEWENFHKDTKRSRVHLPPYQFDRKSYWIEADKNKKPASVKTVAAALNSVSRNIIKSKIKKVIQENSMTRKEYISDILKDTLEELSGISKTQLDETRTFLELGFDSLFMTQVTLAFQKRFDVKITLRQLLESTPTIFSVADFIDSKLPEGKFEPPKLEKIIEEEGEEIMDDFEGTIQESQKLNDSFINPGNSAAERLVFEQLELMKKQLEIFEKKGTQTAPPVRQKSDALKEKSSPASEFSAATDSPLPLKEEKKVFERFGPYKPIETKKGGELTPKQQKYLDKLILDYNKKTQKSKQLTQEHRAHYADPRTVSGFLPLWKEMTYQIVTNRSEGSRLWDIDNNEYVDVLMGFGQYLFGHNPKFIRNAIEDQIKKGFEIGPQFPIAGEVAKMICEFTGMDRAGFCVTGSEAVLGAIRAARTVTGKDKIVFFAGDYHGIIDEVLVKTNRFGDQLKTMPIAPGIPRENVQNSIVLEYGTEESLNIIEKLLPDIAAVMVEPVQARRPDFRPKEFLQKLRDLTAKADIPLIFDEVVTGFRTCQGGAQEYYGIKADIATYGKVIGGGFPIGVIAGRSLYMDAFDGGMWQYGDDSIPEAGVTFFAGTFARHPLSLTASYAALKYLQSKNGSLQEELNNKTARLADELNEFMTQRNMPMKILNFSSVFYYAYPKDLTYFSLLFYVLRQKGLHILEGFPVFLSEAHTDEDIQFIIDVFKESITELQDNGFFPAPLPDNNNKENKTNHAEVKNEIPLSEAQQEIWIASTMNDMASCAFNESSHLVLKGRLNIKALEKAFEKVIERHESLRTTFSSDGLYQIVHKDVKFKLKITDLSELSAQEKTDRVDNRIKSETTKVFDFVNGPLIRAELLKLNDEDYRLIITAHHIICDGWSYDVMVRDLSRTYSEEINQNHSAQDRPMQMRDFISYLKNIKETEEYKEQEKYWLKHLSAPLTESALPIDFKRPGIRTFEGKRFESHIPENIFKGVKQLGIKTGNTLFVTMVSAFSLLLNKLTQEDDIITGIPVAGQQIVGADDLIGHCTNLLPLRFKIDQKKKFSEYLKQVKSLVLDAYDNQQVTYGDIIAKLKIKRSPDKAPLISTMFNIDPAIIGLKFSGLESEFLANPISGYQFEFGFNLVNFQDDCLIECDYNTGLFSSGTIQKFIKYYNYILEQVIDNPDIPINEIQILSSSDIEGLMNLLNSNKREPEI